MTAPLIHGNRRTIPASAFLKAIGDDLCQIKAEDGLTWVDLGRELGKSEDQAAKYADASAEMPVTTFLHARTKWGSRISGRADALVDAGGGAACDRAALSSVLACAQGLAEMRIDGVFDVADVHANRKTIEGAVASLTALLGLLGEER